MVNKEEVKEERKEVKEIFTLQEFEIKNNIDIITLAGFEAYLNIEGLNLTSEKEFDKTYKKYLASPGFI